MFCLQAKYISYATVFGATKVDNLPKPFTNVDDLLLMSLFQSVVMKCIKSSVVGVVLLVLCWKYAESHIQNVL